MKFDGLDQTISTQYGAEDAGGCGKCRWYFESGGVERQEVMMVRSCAESEMERYAQGYRRRRDIAVIRIKEFREGEVGREPPITRSREAVTFARDVKINSGWIT